MITLLTIVGLFTLYSMYKVIYRADYCSMFEALMGSLGWAFLIIAILVGLCYLIIKYLP